MTDDPGLVSTAPAPLDPEQLAHALARADLKAKLFGPPADSERVGRFSILRRVGAGGMGVVYAAYDEQLDRRIALKLVHGGRHDPTAAARMRREAQALARLSHPNVVHVYEIGEARGQVYIAMEFVQGETLRAWQERAPRSWREIVAMYVKAGRGLAAAHAVGLVHRDFKPENVLVGEDGRPRVVDFGLARVRKNMSEETCNEGARKDMADEARAETLPELTAAGALVGTPAYMAPEQHVGGEADVRSDVFAFCVALHEALHGVRPFAGARREEVYAAIQAGAVQRGAREVPAWLQRAIERGLAADPQARWPGMEPLLSALGRDPARIRRWVGLGLVGLLATGGGGLWLWRRVDETHVREIAHARARAAETEVALAQTRAVAESVRLAAASVQVADDPALRLLLAVEAVAVRTERGEAPTIEAQQALLEALAGPRSDLFARPGAAAVDAVAESDDGRWLATGERAGTVALWSTEAPRAPADVLEGTGEVRGLAWSAEGALAIVRAGAPPVVATRAGQGSLQEHVSWDISLAEPRDPQWSGRGALVVRDNAHAVILQAGAAARAIGGGAPLRKARWSPDGAQLLTAAADGALQLWPADGGEPRSLRLPGPAVGLVTAEWRGDGREVVVGRADGSVVLVPIGGGVARRLVGHTDEVYAASYVPGGQQVVSVSRDGTARVWDASGGSEAIELQGHAEVLLGVQVSAGGDLLLGAPAGGEAWLWQLEVRGPPLRLRGHEGSVVATGFSRDGARVLTGSSDGSARRFRIADDPWLLRGHAAGIEQAIAHPDGRTVLTSSLDGTIRVWPRDGRGAHRLGGHREGGAPLLALSPDGRRLLSAGGDGRVRVWSLAGEKPVPEASIQGERGVAFLDASWSPTGDVVALAGEDGRVSLLRLAGDGPPSLVRQAVHTGSVRVLKFMPNGTSIASAGDPGDVVVTSLEFDVKAMFEGHAGPVRTLAVSGDGGRLASAGDDGVVRIWSLADPGAAPLELRGHEGSIGQVVLRPDGAAALTAAADGTAREWPLHGGEPAVLRGHEDAVWVALYSPDGAMILTASADGNARLWTREAEGWTALILPHAPAGGPGEPERALWTGAFSPDGRFVVTAGADGLARVFPVRLADRVAEACARAGRDLTPDEWRHHLGDRPYRRTCL